MTPFNNTQPKIVSIREVQMLNPANAKIEPFMAVTFTVGNHGPFVENFVKAGFDAGAINVRLADFASRLALIQGQ